jgi:hypothetical protein
MKDREIEHSSNSVLFTHTTDAPTLPPGAFFEEALWRTNARRFVLFAARRIRCRSWRGSFDGRPPGGKEAEDYVSEARELLMSGQRRYTARYSPERCVYATIASLISHDADAAENQIPHDYLTTLARDDENDHALGVPAVTALDTPSIEETIAAREYLEKFKSNFTDEALRRYLDLLADGYVTAAEAAAELDLLESDIWNIRKALKRPRGQWPGKPPRQ